MAYIDLDYLYQRYSTQLVKQLADRDGSGDADTEIINQAIAAADGTIDSYLRARYTAPISPVTEEVKALSAAIAFHSLWTTERPEYVRQGYSDAIQFLRDVSTGKAQLSDSSVPVASGGAGSGAKDDDDRVFTSSTLADF